MDFHDLTSVLNRKMLEVALDEVHFALWFWFDISESPKKKVVLFCFLLVLLSNIAVSFSMLVQWTPSSTPSFEKRKNKIWNKISRLWLLAMRSMLKSTTNMPFDFHFTWLLFPLHPRNLPLETRDQNPGLTPRLFFVSLIWYHRTTCLVPAPIDQSCRSRAFTLVRSTRRPLLLSNWAMHGRIRRGERDGLGLRKRNWVGRGGPSVIKHII